MLFADHPVILRGGGDLATGVALRLHRAGFPVIVCELAHPLTVRRTVALSAAVAGGSVVVEGVVAQRVETLAEAVSTCCTGIVPVLVSPTLLSAAVVPRSVVVDARLAKRSLDTTLTDAPLVVGLGPGFTVGDQCHAVVETQRGARLGRVLWTGSAEPDSRVPGEVGGRGSERVLRAPVAGAVHWTVHIGDRVVPGPIGHVADRVVDAPFAGLVRGLIADGTTVPVGMKIGDIDPRTDVVVDEVSDKALAIGGGVLEAVLTWLNHR